MANTFNDVRDLTVGVNLATDSTGDKQVIPVTSKCEVAYFWCLVRGTSTNATKFILTFYKRPAAGASADVSMGTITKPAGNQQGTFLKFYPTSRLTLTPGMQAVINCSTANGDACAVDAGVAVISSPEADGNISAITKVTA